MASFNKPMSRSKADTMLAGVLDRAAGYNGDPSKHVVISRVRVFGSYCDPDVQLLGDLDLAVDPNDRVPGWSSDANNLSRYSESSGRHFKSMIDELHWPRAEVILLLRRRSAYINVSEEDIDQFTTVWREVYKLGD